MSHKLIQQLRDMTLKLDEYPTTNFQSKSSSPLTYGSPKSFDREYAYNPDAERISSVQKYTGNEYATNKYSDSRLASFDEFRSEYRHTDPYVSPTRESSNHIDISSTRSQSVPLNMRGSYVPQDAPAYDNFSPKFASGYRSNDAYLSPTHASLNHMDISSIQMDKSIDRDRSSTQMDKSSVRPTPSQDSRDSYAANGTFAYHELKEMKQKLQNKDVDVQGLLHSIKDLTKELELTQERLNDAQATISSIQETKEILTQKRDEKQTQIKDIMKENKLLSSKIVSLELQIRTLDNERKQDQEKAENEIEATKNHLAQFQVNYVKLQSEHAREVGKQAILENLKSEIELLKEEKSLMDSARTGERSVMSILL